MTAFRAAAGAWLLLTAAFAAACGEAVFSPTCRLPQRGELARPAAAAKLSDGTFAVANADPDELFCGGFISRFDAAGNEIADPQLLEIDGQYEANFGGMATTATRLWVSGRRYGYLLGIRQSDGVIDKAVTGVYADRVYYAGPDYVVAWTARNTIPDLMWFDDNGDLKARDIGSSSPLRATAYDPKRQRVWLAYDGGKNVQFVDLPAIAHTANRFPRGVGIDHNIRGMAVSGDVVYAVDYNAALLLSWDAESGEALGAETVGFLPEAVAIADDRVWVLDAAGAVFVRQAGAWRQANAILTRPVAFQVFNDRAWVLDFAAQVVVGVDAP